MQLITAKLTAIRQFAPEGWSQHDLRNLIHGVGDSPRRAKRALKTPDVATSYRDAFAADIEAGVHFKAALKAANERWLAANTRAEPEDEADRGRSRRRGRARPQARQEGCHLRDGRRPAPRLT